MGRVLVCASDVAVVAAAVAQPSFIFSFLFLLIFGIHGYWYDVMIYPYLS